MFSCASTSSVAGLQRRRCFPFFRRPATNTEFEDLIQDLDTIAAASPKLSFRLSIQAGFAYVSGHRLGDIEGKKLWERTFPMITKRGSGHSNKETIPSIKTFAALLPKYGVLEGLYISNGSMSNEFLLSVRDMAKNSLTQITLHKIHISARQLARLLKILCNHPMEELSFEFCGLDDNCSTCLVAYLPHFKRLQSLDLSGHRFGLCSIRRLSFSHLFCDDVGSYYVGSILMLPWCHIRSLSLTNVEIPNRFLQGLFRNFSVKILDLSRVEVSTDLLRKLTDCLVQKERARRPLEELVLAKCQIYGGTGFRKLLQLEALPSLRKLDLSENSLGRAGILAIAKSLARNCRVEELRLGDQLHEIPEAAMLQLTKSLKKNSDLKELFANLRFYAHGLVATELLRSLLSNETLTFVDIMRPNDVKGWVLNKIEYYLKANRYSLRHDDALNFPAAAMPRAFVKLKRPDLQYTLLRKRPGLLRFAGSQKQEL